jgi:hypothetical protein
VIAELLFAPAEITTLTEPEPLSVTLVIEGAAATVATIAVEALLANVEPEAFVPVAAKTTKLPSCALVSVNVVLVAPEMPEQEVRLSPAALAEGQEYQARALTVGVALPVNIPAGSVAVIT